MIKRLLGLTLAMAIIFILNAIVLADPGCGGDPENPINPRSLPVVCLEYNQGQDEDND